jgi:hypothetical protein
MKGLGVFILLLAAIAIATAARSGHEPPIYPSYYPHEIDIQTIAPEAAAVLLLEGKLQAYVGSEPRFTGIVPDFIRAVESLGSFVIVRVNAQSPLIGEGRSDCAIGEAVVHDMAGRAGLIFHPYPVTPFHGDYLYHVDLADAAKAHFSRASSDPSVRSLSKLKVKAIGGLAQGLVRPDWLTRDGQWDAEVETLSADVLMATSSVSLNGWLGPSWAKTGWFHAERLLADAAAGAAQERAAEDFARLTAGEFDHLTERINLERELVASLTAGCGKIIAGYTVKREYVSDEFSAGIENIGFDSIEGLHSPMFIRTAKLKDFPWNGWLMVGIDARPAAAWNPIAGMTDTFGRLAWYALGDPALLPSPYDAGWMLNRASDVQPGQ